MDTPSPAHYIVRMRLWVRLVTLCLSLALLGGVLLHETASAKMSFDMAASQISATAEGDACPACALEDADEIVCEPDCSVPAVLAAAVPPTVPTVLRRAQVKSRTAISLHGLDHGVDPTPPRSTLLS